MKLKTIYPLGAVNILCQPVQQIVDEGGREGEPKDDNDKGERSDRFVN